MKGSQIDEGTSNGTTDMDKPDVGHAIDGELIWEGGEMHQYSGMQPAS